MLMALFAYNDNSVHHAEHTIICVLLGRSTFAAMAILTHGSCSPSAVLGPRGTLLYAAAHAQKKQTVLFA
jgi:hypothetical protein